jgi:hypothetical protein
VQGRYIRLGYDPRLKDVAGQSPVWNQPIQIRTSSAVWSVLSRRNAECAADSAVESEVGAGDTVTRDVGACDVVAPPDDVPGTDSDGQKPWLQPSPEDALLIPPSSRSFSIIPVQLRHPMFDEWKATIRALEQFDPSNGWFSSEDLDSMRGVIEKALQSMLTDAERQSLAALEREHVLAQDGRKGRTYTSLLRNSTVLKSNRRSQLYKHDRIKKLQALAPIHIPSAGSISGNATPASAKATVPALAQDSRSRASAASSAVAQGKSNQSQHLTAQAAALTSQSNLESRDGESSHLNVMSQLSSTNFSQNIENTERHFSSVNASANAPNLTRLLSDISNLAVIATQDSGSDYDIFSGSSSNDSDSSGGSDVSDA